MADETTAITPPTVTEVGYVNPGESDFYAYGLETETVPELQFPNGFRVYDRMRTDSQVSAVLKAICLPIRATTWRIDPAGADNEVVEFVAEQLNLPIIGKEGEPAPVRRRRRFSWDEHLRHALLMIPYGSMFFEQVVEPTPDGKWGLRKLAPRMPLSLSAINVARDGGLLSIEQQAPSSLTAVRASDAHGHITIPVDRLVAYSFEREGGDWAGQSLLRPAYPHWALKHPLMKIEAMAVERNSMGVPTYFNPPGASKEDIEKGRKMAQAHRAGDQSGASLPYESKYQLLGVTGQLMDPRPVIDAHDKAIGRVALAHFLNLDGQGGSYALASTQEDLFTTSANSVATQVADVATQHVVADLVDWNYGPDTPIPRVVFDDLRSDSLAIANALRVLADAGLIRPDRSMEEWLRRDMGAPAKDTPAPEQPWTPPEGGDGDGTGDSGASGTA